MGQDVECHIYIPKTWGVNNWANVEFAICALALLLRFNNFATYLQGANLCKSIFFLQV